jgi:hypothetical protein
MMLELEGGGNELVSMSESEQEEDYFIHSITFPLITCKSVFVRNISLTGIVIL